MNLNHLRAFCLVVKMGSITKAAKKLHISQPALSLQIQELENTFHNSLLKRNNKGVQPTELGLVVYNYGNKILNIARNMEKEAETFKLNSKEKLTIGASSTVGNFAIPCSLFVFKEKYPQHEMSLDISDTRKVVEKLMEGTINIGIIEGPLVGELLEFVHSEKMRVKQIDQDELAVVVPYNEKWEEKNIIDVNELLSLNLILREKGSGIRETIEFALHQEDIPEEGLNVLFELNSINAIISAVTAGIGASILPKMALRKELRRRILKSLKVKGISFEHNVYMLYYPHYSNKPGVSLNFINFIASEEKSFC